MWRPAVTGRATRRKRRVTSSARGAEHTPACAHGVVAAVELDERTCKLPGASPQRTQPYSGTRGGPRGLQGDITLRRTGARPRTRLRLEQAVEAEVWRRLLWQRVAPHRQRLPWLRARVRVADRTHRFSPFLLSGPRGLSPGSLSSIVTAAQTRALGTLGLTSLERSHRPGLRAGVGDQQAGHGPGHTESGSGDRLAARRRSPPFHCPPVRTPPRFPGSWVSPGPGVAALGWAVGHR
jgi:hypothetical protein